MIALIPVNHTILTWHSLLYQTNLPLDHSPHQMTIFRIERLSPIETQKHCISNSLKYNASLHFVYRHVDIITLLSSAHQPATANQYSYQPIYNSGNDQIRYSITNLILKIPEIRLPADSGILYLHMMCHIYSDKCLPECKLCSLHINLCCVI